MLNRDFSKSNKSFIAKTKYFIIGVVSFILIGVLIASIFGFNGNFEMKGYYEFSVNVNENSNYRDYSKVIENKVDKFGGNFDTILNYDEGDNAQLVVRYMNSISKEDETKVKNEIAEALEIEISEIGETTFVKASVRSLDYVFTAAAILLLVAISSVFAFVRYNSASAITIIATAALATLSMLSLSAILRLSIGLSYFAMLVILNMILIYFELELFENMRNESWLGSKKYAEALTSATKQTRARQLFVCIAVLVAGVLLVLLSTDPIKYVSLNILFMSVVLLACAWYVIPYIWSMLITSCKVKEYKVKATNVKDLED